MKKFLLPACFGALLSLTACGGNPPEADVTATPDPLTTVSADSVSSAVGTTTLNGPATTTGNPQVNAVTVQPKASTSGATARLNPAHGQPGHDCAVEVGAPLNAAPQNQSPQTIAPTTPKPAAGGNVKLNPAHGQPGHDCAVAVGAPLNG